MISSFATDYLARTLFLRDEDDLSFIFEAVKKIEPILVPDEVLAVIPCHVEDLEAGVHTCSLVRSQGGRVCLFLNCLAQDRTEEQFYNAVKECITRAEVAGCRVGVDTAVVSRRHGDIAKMGKIRGSITDACVIALMNVGADVPIAFLDADTLCASETFFIDVLTAFRSRSPMMAVASVRYGYRPDGTSCLPGGVHIPELLLADRVNQAILKCARDGKINFERRVWAEGASLTFDPKAYCKIGGFNWNLRSGEDDSFGRAMHRFNPEALTAPLRDVEQIFTTRATNVYFMDSAWLVTDPRRHLKAIKYGGGGTEAWDYVPFDEEAGHELSLSALMADYNSDDGRITHALIKDWDRRGIPITVAAGCRVIELISTMLSADRRIRNPAQERQVWMALGFAETPNAIEPDQQALNNCSELIRGR